MSNKRGSTGGDIERVPGHTHDRKHREVTPKGGARTLSDTYRVRGKRITVSKGSRVILEDTAKAFKGALKRLADK